MKTTIYLTFLFVLPIFYMQNVHMDFINSNQTQTMRTTSLRHLIIGLNELIADINKKNTSRIELVPVPGCFSDATLKITEVGTILKYGVTGTNEMRGSFAAFDSIIEKYFTNAKDRDKFYEKINKKEAEGQK